MRRRRSRRFLNAKIVAPLADGLAANGDSVVVELASYFFEAFAGGACVAKTRLELSVECFVGEGERACSGHRLAKLPGK